MDQFVFQQGHVFNKKDVIDCLWYIYLQIKTEEIEMHSQ